MELMRRRGMMATGGQQYTRCEYIESSGDAYLDTGLLPQEYDEIVLDMVVTTIGTWDGFFGTQSNYNNLVNTKRLGFLNVATRLSFVVGTTQYNVAYALAAGQRYIFDCIMSNARRELLIDGQSKVSESTSYTFNSPYSTYLFASNYAGQVKTGEICYAKMYEVTFKKDGQTVAHLLPAYSGTEIGMYDEVRDLFMTSIGSAPFTKGADA